MTAQLIFIGILLLTTLSICLFRHAWRTMDNTPVLPASDEEAWRQAMAKHVPSEPKPLVAKPDKNSLYVPVKMAARFTENKPKPAKGQHKKKKNRKRQASEEVVKGVV